MYRTKINKITIKKTEKIYSDFCFFIVSAEKESSIKEQMKLCTTKLIKSDMFKEISDNFSIYSCVSGSYKNKPCLFVMCPKKACITENDIKNYLTYSYNKTYPNNTRKSSVYKVKSATSEISDETILKLFFFKFNNINEPTFIVRRVKNKKYTHIICLNIDLQYDEIQLKVKTFSPTTERNKTTKTGTIRQTYVPKDIENTSMTGMQIAENNEDETYVCFADAKRIGSRESVCFLDFRSGQGYLKSKIGILYNFKTEFNKKFNEYIFFDFIAVNYKKRDTKADSRRTKAMEKNIVETINKFGGLYVSNKSQNKNIAKYLVKNINNFLNGNDLKVELSNDIQHNKFNLVAVMDKNYYGNSDSDTYYDDLEERQNAPICHIVIPEDTNEPKISSAQIYSILKELIIKKSIIDGRVLLPNISFNADNDVFFGGVSSSNCFYGISMSKQSGEIFIKKDQHDIEAEKILKEKLDGVSNSYLPNYYVVKKGDNIGIIELSGQFSLGDIDKLDKELRSYAPDFRMAKKDIYNILIESKNSEYKAFAEKFLYEFRTAASVKTIKINTNSLKETVKNVCDYLRDKVTDSSKKMQKKDAYNLLINSDNDVFVTFAKKNMSSFLNNEQQFSITESSFGFNMNTLEEICKYLSQKEKEKSGIEPFKTLKNKKTANDIFVGLYNNCYFWESENTICYFVGQRLYEKGSKIEKASLIRKITFKNKDDAFVEFILELIDVQFVKWADKTVLPFPAKIVRESYEIDCCEKYSEPIN